MHQTIRFFNEKVFDLRYRPKVTPSAPPPISEEEITLRRTMLAALKGKAVSDSHQPANFSQPNDGSWTFLASDSPKDSVTALTGNLDGLHIGNEGAQLFPPTTFEYLKPASHPPPANPPKLPVVQTASPPVDQSNSSLARADIVDDLSDLTEPEDEAPAQRVSALALARQHSALLNDGQFAK